MAEEPQASKRVTTVRRAVRETLGVAFWTHALYVSNLIPLPTLPYPSIPRYLFNSLLLILIVNYSVFSYSGWFSVLFDLGFLYFLPFIYAKRLIWLLAKSSASLVRNNTATQRFQLITAPQPQTASTGPLATALQSLRKKTTSPDRSWAKRLIFKFSLLWSIYVFTIQYRPALAVVCILTLLGAFGAFRLSWNLFSGEPEWVLKIEQAIAGAMKTHRDLILKWDGVSEKAKIRTQMNSLRIYEFAFNFVAGNRALFLKWTIAISLVLSLPIYVYISYLFACTYFGICKVVGLAIPFPTLMVDSLYMPFAWAVLPNQILIQLIGGVQGILVTVMGWTILYRHLSVRFEKIISATQRLNSLLVEDSVQKRMNEVQSQLTQDAQVPEKK